MRVCAGRKQLAAPVILEPGISQPCLSVFFSFRLVQFARVAVFVSSRSEKDMTLAVLARQDNTSHTGRIFALQTNFLSRSPFRPMTEELETTVIATATPRGLRSEAANRARGRSVAEIVFVVRTVGRRWFHPWDIGCGSRASFEKHADRRVGLCLGEWGSHRSPRSRWRREGP